MTDPVRVLRSPAARHLVPILGDHPSIIALRHLIARAAPHDIPIVIEGPTGAGKELVAEHLHALSGRQGPLIAVNVATLPETLLDAELFGAERGAYTGAMTERRGLLEQAHGGTLFLDEAADLPVHAQAKLLRAVETRTIRRVGGVVTRPAAFRLVVSTQIAARELVDQKRWRDDFYYRVAGLMLQVPPLAERRSDIPVLAAAFIHRFEDATLEPDALAALQSHPWPGNVRELFRILERASFLALPDPITAAHIDAALGADGEAIVSEPRTFQQLEVAHLRRVLAEQDFDVANAAPILGLSRSQLYRRIKASGIVLPRRA